jgi:hypothetical protein
MEDFKQIKNKLRVVHFPQVGVSKNFAVEVKSEREAYLVLNTLANQHLFLYENKFIPDYSNIILVEMYNEEIDEETKQPYGWEDYFNDEMGFEWDDVELYFSEKEQSNG